MDNITEGQKERLDRDYLLTMGFDYDDIDEDDRDFYTKRTPFHQSLEVQSNREKVLNIIYHTIRSKKWKRGKAGSMLIRYGDIVSKEYINKHAANAMKSLLNESYELKDKEIQQAA